MNLTEKNNILFQLGTILNKLSVNDPWPGYEIGINAEEYEELQELVQTVHIYNGWFKEEQVRQAFGSISSWLSKESLSGWESNYSIREKTGKSVAIIMAGNIPLVGFHDFISVFLSGHKAIVKLSSDDQHLFPALLKTMALFDESILEWVELASTPIQGFDAVIATGSDNSSRYFESYFGKYPNIIRKNRSSIAVLDGSETEEDLQTLGKDIFDYFGLGCRNVSQVWIPKDYKLDKLFEALYGFNEIIHHNKYANNYDYNKAVMLLNEVKLLDNGFILLKEDQSLHTPLAVLHYVRYDSEAEVQTFIKEQEAEIQVVIGKNYGAFGQSQCPALMDYADGVDTMAFLAQL